MATDPRQQRGILIAATCRLHRNDDGTWLVPSQTNRTAVGYVVNLDAKTRTCPDHVEGGFTCKHYFAASIVHQRDVLPDGTVIETRSVTLTEKKVYKQDWPAYNVAQATEKRRVRVLLHDLCRNLPDRERPENYPGPKPHCTRDAIFSMAYKVYCQLSCRRFSTDLLEAHERGFVTRPIDERAGGSLAPALPLAQPVGLGRPQEHPRHPGGDRSLAARGAVTRQTPNPWRAPCCIARR